MFEAAKLKKSFSTTMQGHLLDIKVVLNNIEGLLESLSVHYLGGAIHWGPRARLYLERSAELGSDTPGNIKVGEFVLEVLRSPWRSARSSTLQSGKQRAGYSTK